MGQCGGYGQLRERPYGHIRHIVQSGVMQRRTDLSDSHINICALPVGEVVRKACFLTADQQLKLLSRNALRYLGRSE